MHHNIEQTYGQDHPDENVGDDSAREIMAVHSDGAVPEQCKEGPGIGSRDSGQMHESWEAPVTPVGGTLVDQVGDQNNLRTPEVVASPE